MSYTTKIIENLINNGHYYVSDPFGSELSLKEFPEELSEKLQHIPEDNLKAVLSNFDKLAVNEGRHCCSEFINAAAEAGYLKFDPFVVKERSGATLVLRWNRFVHLFRGYHYQVSYTYQGIGEYQSANVRTDRLMYKYPDLHDSRMFQILLYMNCINACTGIDVFTDTLRKHPEVIDDFVASTAKRYFDNYAVTYADVRGCIKDITNEPDTGDTPIQIFNLRKSDTMDICRIAILNSTTVDVEFAKDKAYCKYRVQLPDWRVGLDAQSDAVTEDADGYDEDISHDKNILALLASFALNSIGVFVNFHVAYPIVRSDNYIKALNQNGVKELRNLDVLYSAGDLL